MGSNESKIGEVALPLGSVKAQKKIFSQQTTKIQKRNLILRKKVVDADLDRRIQSITSEISEFIYRLINSIIRIHSPLCPIKNPVKGT